MKRLLIALFVSVALISLANLVVFSDVPEVIRKEQLTEVERAAIPINSIKFSDTNYTDLRNLDSILRGTRVLMLGESTHQDGETFKAKSRLVRYLHENLGYRVVLYEAGQYDMWMMNQAMESSDADLLKGAIGGIGLFEFWWANEENQPLIDYYRASKKTSLPIELGGFDIQFSGSHLNERRAQLLREFLGRNGIDLKEYETLNKHVGELPLLTYPSVAVRRLKEEGKARLLLEIDDLVQAVAGLEPSNERVIYQRYLNDIGHNLRKTWSFETGSDESMHFRDSLMARNLIYQIDSLYSDQKVIVWCSNIHSFASRYSDAYIPMGAYIKQKYGDESYMLSFTSFARADADGNLSDRPGKLAVENVFHRSKSPYFLINLRGLPAGSFLKEAFVSNLNQGVDQERVWSKFIDGIFYIDINQNPTNPEK